jgi:hypothetical protein
MPHEPRKNVGESVRARLLQRSRDERVDFQILLTRYALERLLYRLSQSPHRHRFVLEGAMLFAAWVAAPFRPTRDLDLLRYGENSPEAIREAFLTRERMTAAPAHLAPVLADLERFLLPLLEEAEGDWRWKQRAGWVRRIA